MPEGGDSAQAAQANAYRKSSYQPDGAKDYQAFLRDLSWCATPANVPKHAQASLTNEVQDKYSSLHPGWTNEEATVSYVHYGSPTKMRESMQRVASNSRIQTINHSTFPVLSVSEKLPSTYRGPSSGSTSRDINASTLLSSSKGEAEGDGDALFKSGKFLKALQKYDQALTYRNNDIGLLSKRCAVLAHLGKYENALADAVVLCQLEGSCKSINRKQCIEKHMSMLKNGETGFETGHITLLHLITPNAFKQW